MIETAQQQRCHRPRAALMLCVESHELRLGEGYAVNSFTAVVPKLENPGQIESRSLYRLCTADVHRENDEPVCVLLFQFVKFFARLPDRSAYRASCFEIAKNEIEPESDSLACTCYQYIV